MDPVDKPSDDNYVVFFKPEPKSKPIPETMRMWRVFLRKKEQEEKCLIYYVIFFCCFATFFTCTTVGLYHILYVQHLKYFHSLCGSTHRASTDQNKDSLMYKPLHGDAVNTDQMHIVVVDPNPLPVMDPNTNDAATGPPSSDIQADQRLPNISAFLKELSINSSQPSHCDLDIGARFDCFPGTMSSTIGQNICLIHGCCWDDHVPQGVPYCFYPPDFPTYDITSEGVNGAGISLTMTRKVPTKWPNEVKTLRVDVMYETNNRLHFKIYDPAHKRYEVPLENMASKTSSEAVDPQYTVTIPPVNQPFSLAITRKTSGSLLFNTSGVPLMFADQFIQMSTQLGSQYIYGLGEHRTSFLQNINWTKMSFWSRDQPPMQQTNLYGDHPFFLGLDKQGAAYGVFLLNSNAMQIDLQPMPALTYRTSGGILDFYVFMGPAPDDVLRQYTDVIGKPTLPPYWGLGFHLCRYGYNSSDGLQKVITRMRASKIPYDTQWNDIDYMRSHLDWTYDRDRYADLPAIVQDLHNHGQHYIMIVDPGISSTQPRGQYPPYDDGLSAGVFILKADKSGPIIGKVWPGETAFPDFFNPASQDWWFNQMKAYHDLVPFDGVWIDMNEPSNFVAGSVDGCPSSSLNNPPWTPGIGGGSLIDKTLCPSAQQHISTHYNLHSLYGHSEARATSIAAEKLLGSRTVVISRSTFPGTGRHAGHWRGDNISEWPDLRYSIPGILNFQLFGVPFVGVDICGFRGNTNPELCTRWMQVGSFYPFMRNHNTLGAQDQDPAAFDSATQSAMRKAVNARYNLLPYLYTLFFHSHVNGTAVARPLMFQFTDPQTYGIDQQFLWGDSLLISPVTDQGATSVKAYIPKGTWYDYYTGAQVKGLGQFVTLSAPLDHINLHLRGMTIIPTQPPNVTTTLARRQKYGLLVSLCEMGRASGDLFVDDGQSLATVESGKYSWFSFSVKNNVLTSIAVRSNYHPDTGIVLGRCRVMGLTSEPGNVQANGITVPFFFNSTTNVLDIDNLSLDMFSGINIKWT